MNSVILLVDDNLIQATIRKAILAKMGRHVISASSGQEALDLLASREMAHRIGLIITDHLMPGMNGPDLVQEVRQRGWTTPVLVLSGLPDAEFAYEDLNVTFRMKPCPPDTLVALVREMLRDVMPRTA